MPLKAGLGSTGSWALPRIRPLESTGATPRPLGYRDPDNASLKRDEGVVYSNLLNLQTKGMLHS